MCREVGLSRLWWMEIGTFGGTRGDWSSFLLLTLGGSLVLSFHSSSPVLRGAVGAMVMSVIRVVVTVPPVVQGSILPMLHSERRRSCGWLQAFLNTCKDHPQDTSIRLSVQ